MDLQIVSHQPRQSHAAGAIAHPFRTAAVKLRHLKGADAIASVAHLREEIDLSVHAAAGPHFVALEKKETSAALCSVSSSMGS